ncbi:ABC transporter permease [Algiphilus sp.]|uniref:ABC transporter permease n=1 Tax=Algiphilus sp. TaxID=1872431 RepID=UPI001CA7819F|nr:ABC transporter permease [Algiphilus sp.]MBY8966186.1 ABC transporter permease [Algiphilus acroporae]MCI5062909.1 ABC transporter permease [Algiphilus sp.]MCI5103863.1 ABC transporter permease [Algiphilus sp.]MCR9091893.1 ABC transporter permease [Pseudomonadota bacterium]
MQPDHRGLLTVVQKEVRRFWSVVGQTVTAPVITALLFLLVFSHVLEGRDSGYPGVAYTQFLVPGLMMMQVLQNAFANTSSSIAQSKIMGNMVFLLMAPLSARDLFVGYIVAALLRSTLVAAVIFVVTWPIVGLPVSHPFALLAILLLAAGSMGSLGIIAGVIANKFDHIAAFQNFLIMPLTFLSGVFYSVHGLPDFWFEASLFNPFFYMIDGFRYGFFGVADVSIWRSLAWSLGFFALSSGIAIAWLASGYRLRA